MRQLRDMELQLRGASRRAEYARRGSLWDAHAQVDGDFYALLHAGRLRAAYLDPRDPPDVLNYKRALLSLFQVPTYLTRSLCPPTSHVLQVPYLLRFISRHRNLESEVTKPQTHPLTTYGLAYQLSDNLDFFIHPQSLKCLKNVQCTSSRSGINIIDMLRVVFLNF